jgi:hypothetical protein
MQQEDGEQTVLEHLVPPLDFASPFDGEEFAALLVLKIDVTADDRALLAECLVREGCRHAVLWGKECEEWEAAIDEAAGFDGSGGEVVLATSHEGEPLEDVIDSFYDDTAFESFDPEHFVVVVVGGSDRDAEKVQDALDERQEERREASD